MHEDIVPEPVWEQDVSNGGEVGGDLPPVAAPVVVQGVAHVREVPPLRHSSGAVTLATTARPFGIGRNVRRRRLLVSVVSADPTAYAVAGDDAQQVAGEYGLAIPAGVVVELRTADRLYFAAFGAELRLTWLAELDQG